MIKSVNYNEKMSYIRIEPENKELVPVLLRLFKPVLHPNKDLHNESKTSVYLKTSY